MKVSRMAPGTGDPRPRRLIVASYFFPPSESVGARRWEMLARLLAARGWELDIVACGDAQAQARCRWRCDGVKVHYVPQPRMLRSTIEAQLHAVTSRMMQRIHRRSSATSDVIRADSTIADVQRPSRRGWELGTLRGWLRLHWALADVAWSRAWGKRAARHIAGIASEGRPCAIISSTPPHPAHLAISRMADRLGIPFVMDLRDPWSLADAVHEPYDTPLGRGIARRMERECFNRATLIIANTPPAQEAFAAQYPEAAPRIISIMNGADDDPLPPVARDPRFVIAYAGTVYTEKDPRALLRGVSEFLSDSTVRAESVRVQFMGEFGPEGGCPIAAIAAEEGVGDRVDVYPRQSRAAAAEFMAKATVLAVFQGFNPVSVPAKVFECTRFPVRLLALAGPETGTARLLEGTAATVVAPRDTPAIAATLKGWYTAYCNGESPERPVDDDRFSRAHQADRLAGALERIQFSS